MEMIAPFGPKIGQCRVPDEVFNDLLDITDNILMHPEEHKRTGYGYWDGVFDNRWPCKNQFDIPIDFYYRSSVYSYLSEQVIKYAQATGTHIETIPDDMDVDIFHSWFNSMTKHEDIPPHNHHGLVSGIIYCKLPYANNDERVYKEGVLHIINNSCVLDGLENGSIQLMPKEQNMYLFPARLFHSVSSYSNNVERRVVSFNANIFNTNS